MMKTNGRTFMVLRILLGMKTRDYLRVFDTEIELKTTKRTRYERGWTELTHTPLQGGEPLSESKAQDTQFHPANSLL